MISGALLPKFFYMPFFCTGGILALTGGALMHTITLDSSTSRIYGYSAVTAFGTGLFVKAAFSVAQAKVEPPLVPKITAFISCSQISSITFSLAIANSIFINRAVGRIATILPGIPIQEVQAAIAGVDAKFLTGLGAEDLRSILEAIVATIGEVYIIVIAGGSLAAVLSLFMKRERLFT